MINNFGVKENGELSISTLLFRQSPRLLLVSVALGAIAGALYSLIIPVALLGVDGSPSDLSEMGIPADLAFVVNDNLPLLFFVVVFLILVSKLASVVLVNNIAIDATAQLKIRLSKKINRMMIADVENIGFSKLLNILADDVNDVSSSAVAIPMLVVSIVTVFGVLAYLFVLNVYVFLIILLSIVVGLAIYQVPVELVHGYYTRARGVRDVIQKGVCGLVMGAYELKLSELKSESFIREEIVKPQNSYVRLIKFAEGIHHFAGTSSDMLAFFVIGIIVFVVPNFINLPDSDVYGVVMALLYITGPLANILSIDLLLRKGKVAIRRINDLEAFKEEAQATEGFEFIDNWSEYRATEVTYIYFDDYSNSTFSLKPATLKFSRGQINFIVGGNGSGKSTLSKLLSLHYKPQSGSLAFDGMRIHDSNIREARLKISVIYSNYHLFDKIYPLDGRHNVERINLLLAKLGLVGKTDYVNGCFSTTKLSDGQKRRLALLVALLEDKEIYIFDEWAADQDPQFKRVFYEDILQELRAANKLVIVITHDDRFYSCADRVIHIDNGKIVSLRERDKQEMGETSYLHLSEER